MRRLCLLIVLVIVASGCSQLDREPSSPPEQYTREQALNSVLDTQDIFTLDFYSNKKIGQRYESESIRIGSELQKFDEDRIELINFVLASEEGYLELNDKNVPTMMSSSAYYYDNPGDAVKKQEAMVNWTRKNNDVIEYRETGTGKLLKINTDSGSNIVAIYYRKRNVILATYTNSLADYKTEEARQIIKKMQSKLENGQN